MESIHISRSVSKLGDIPSINLTPGCTCRPDAPCFKKCYARKGRFSFSNNKQLLANNTKLWNTSPLMFEEGVYCGVFSSKYVRWHSAGDIPDAKYLDMMFRIANRLKDTTFLCFTKKYELVNEYLNNHDCPANLVLVLSAWGSFIPKNPHSLPVSYVKFKKEAADIPEDARPCMKDCAVCVKTGKSCFHLKNGESVFFDEH